jgi:ABC-type Fe3+/spermidine/putrescine transport system ATPase subunit
MPLLEIENLAKRFTPDTWAVHDVSLNVDEGAILCLLGPSGCGKTTLLRMIAGLEEPDHGHVRFDGGDITRTPPHQRDFGMMFQDFALFPHKNVFENVAFGLRMHHLPEAQIRERVAAMLQLVDLTGFDRRDIDRLSGGEQQRVALARALAPGPRLLMLDLRQILKQVNVTALYVTHDQTEAFAIADRIAVMNAGHLEQLAPPQTVYDQPASPFVARFLGFTNLLDGTVQPSGQLDTVLGSLTQPDVTATPDQPVTLLIRPEAAHLTTESNQPPPGYLPLTATITAISFRGKYYQVWVEVKGVRLMFELRSIADWQVGEVVHLSLDPAEMVILP